MAAIINSLNTRINALQNVIHQGGVEGFRAEQRLDQLAEARRAYVARGTARRTASSGWRANPSQGRPAGTPLTAPTTLPQIANPHPKEPPCTAPPPRQPRFCSPTPAS